MKMLSTFGGEWSLILWLWLQFDLQEQQIVSYSYTIIAQVSEQTIQSF